MKIVYLHQYFNTPSEPGGTRSYEMARRMVGRGHEVHMITTDRSHSLQEPGWSVLEVDGIIVHRISIPYSNKMSFYSRIRAFSSFALKASLRARRIAADVVFASSTPLTVAIPGIFATIFSRGVMVLEVRDLWPDVPIQLGILRNPLLRNAAKLLEWFAYRHSVSVIALSEGMKRGIVESGVDSNSVHVIPNASDVDLFRGTHARGEIWSSQYPWLTNKPLVVHCGTMGIVNGVEYLAEIAAETWKIDPSVQFVAIGDGNRKDSVERRATELSVLDLNFHILPPVSKTEVAAVFNAATVTTCLVIDVPALSNNSANKVFDSFAAGRPVMINYAGWQKELLESSGAGISVHPTDAASAARELVNFLRDQPRLVRANQASSDLGETEFDRNRLANRLVDILESSARV